MPLIASQFTKEIKVCEAQPQETRKNRFSTEKAIPIQRQRKVEKEKVEKVEKEKDGK